MDRDFFGDQSGWAPGAKVTDPDAALIRELSASGVETGQIAGLFAVPRPTVNHILASEPVKPKRSQDERVDRKASWAIPFDTMDAGRCHKTSSRDYPSAVLRACAEIGLRPVRHRLYRFDDSKVRLRTVELVVGWD